MQGEATRQPDGASKGNGTSRGCGVTRSHATTNQQGEWEAKARQEVAVLAKASAEQWHHGGLDNNQLKSGSNCDRNGSLDGYGTCGNGGGGSGRSRGRRW